MHAEGHIHVARHLGHATQLQGVVHTGAGLNEAGASPEAALKAREDKEEYDHKGQDLQREPAGPAQAAFQRQARMAGTHEGRVVVHQAKRNVAGHQKRIAEEHAAGHDKVVQNRRHHGVVAAPELEELEADHEYQQRDEELDGQAFVGGCDQDKTECAGHGEDSGPGAGQGPEKTE